jgi:hypothetical protein
MCGVRLGQSAAYQIGHEPAEEMHQWYLLPTALQSVRSEDDDEFVVLQKPIAEIRRAFADMRGRSAHRLGVQSRQFF